MTESALILVLPTVLIIVLLLGFVGCAELIGIDPWNPVEPEPEPYTPYSNIIKDERSLVAYWPLGEAAGSTTAVDVEGGRDGTYTSKMLPADPPPVSSAAAPGTLNLEQPGLLPGDTVPPHGPDDPPTTCIEVDGGFVVVPFDAVLNPAVFSVEAWVHVGWKPDSPAGNRAIMASFDTNGGAKGFALYVGDDNVWEAVVGTGSATEIANGPDVVFDTTYHVVLTYDGADLRLFLNGTAITTKTTASPYQPSTESRLLIGVGAPHLPEERSPWVGKLQCVALYNSALLLEQVLKHYDHGIAKAP